MSAALGVCSEVEATSSAAGCPAKQRPVIVVKLLANYLFVLFTFGSLLGARRVVVVVVLAVLVVLLSLVLVGPNVLVKLFYYVNASDFGARAANADAIKAAR